MDNSKDSFPWYAISKAVVYWVLLLTCERTLQSCLFDTIEVVGSLRTATGYREVEREQNPATAGLFSRLLYLTKYHIAGNSKKLNNTIGK